MKRHTTIAWLSGLAAAGALFGLYLFVLSLANSWSHAWQQYLLLKWWMTPLVLLFGLQIGLFTYLRGALKARHASGAATGAVAATGGVSAGSMVACCLHHVTDVLPLVGLGAAALFLTTYQEAFLLLGLLSSLLGLAWMLKLAQEHRIGEDGSLLALSRRLPWNRIMPSLLLLSLFLLAIKLFVIIRT